MPIRDLSAGIVSRVGNRVIYPAIFFEGVFWSTSLGAEQTLNMWSGVGPFVWDAKTWQGAGNLMGVAGIGESTDLRAIGFEVSLSGQSSTNIALVKRGTRQGKPGTIWLGLLTQAGVLADTPYELKRGKLDVAVINDSGEVCKIAVRYEDVLIDLERAREQRYTHEGQQPHAPGDQGYRFVPDLQDMAIMWGRPV